MLILVRVVFESMLMTVLLLLQKSTIKYYAITDDFTHYCYACIHVHSIQSNDLTT